MNAQLAQSQDSSCFESSHFNPAGVLHQFPVKCQSMQSHILSADTADRLCFNQGEKTG